MSKLAFGIDRENVAFMLKYVHYIYIKIYALFKLIIYRSLKIMELFFIEKISSQRPNPSHCSTSGMNLIVDPCTKYLFEILLFTLIYCLILN